MTASDPRLAWAQAFISGIPYARASGMELVACSPEEAILRLPARQTWTGDAHRGLIHPGCLSVLADTACGVAVGCALERAEPIATLDLRMDYLRPALAMTDLLCRAEAFRISRNVAFVRGEVTQPGQSEVIATVQATFMRATASTARQDLPTPMQAAASLAAPASIEPSEVVPSTPDNSPECRAVPTGRSPYVDFLDVHQQGQVDAGPIFRLPFQPALIGNPVLPALHGGVLAGFGETAMILHLLATNPTIGRTPDASRPRSIDFAIAYMRSAKPLDTYAQSTTVRQGNRVALVMVSLWQDDPRRPVVQARGHFLMPQD